MDGLSTAASIIAVIQLSSEVVKYIGDATGATKDRIRLRNEVLGCEAILQQLRDDSEESKKWSETIKALEAPSAPLGHLQIALDIIKTKLQPKEGFEKALAGLKWPFQEKEVNKIISAIEREKNLLALALANNSRKLIQDIKKSARENGKQLAQLINTIKETSKESQGRLSELKDDLERVYVSQAGLTEGTILDWLAPIDYASQQSDFVNRRQTGTGQWLLNSEEYQTWLQTAKKTLFCPGIPGAGKTILTSIVVDDLTVRSHYDRGIGVAYIYCNFRRQEEQKADDLLISLLKQLSQERSSITDRLKTLYNQHKDKRTRPSFNEISKTLQSVAAVYLRVFIVIDALDECQASDGCRTRFLAEISYLQEKSGANVFATSRFIPEISEHFKGSILLEIRASGEDVRRYIDSHILRLPGFVSRSQELQEEIRTVIVQSVEGMFLLAQLHLDSLVGKRSPKAVRAALTKLPTGSGAYNSAYQDAMERIEGQVKDQEDLAKLVLSWITCAKRPLTTSEFQHALAVEVSQSKLDEDNLPDIEDMVSVCAGLVTVDEESDIIRLIHYTMQEYFVRTQSRWFPNAEADITTVCITYLSFSVFGGGFCQMDDEFEERLSSNRLYDYAAQNWGHHARTAPIEIGQLILGFLQTESKVSGSSQVMMAAKDYHYRGYSQDVPRQMTGVHLAACFGLRDITMALLENAYEPDLKDTYGRTPLSYAAERGYETVVALLLAKAGVNPDSKDFVHGWTPLWYAVARGQTTVVKLLLEKGEVDPDSKSKHEQTPLSWAATNGHNVVVKLLLDKAGVNPNSKDFEYGRTPLSWAAERGQKAVVEVLLAKNGIDLDSKSKCGRTPLWFSRERGHEAITKLLLANNGVEADMEYSKYGHMPLWYAAEMGQEAMVKLLLKDGVDPDSKSAYRRTPLSYAAERGHEGIVKLLLKTDEVDSDSKDPEYGRTPLSWAAANGHEAIVKLLLEETRVNVNSKCKNGRTPLSWAARFGHGTAVKLLLMEDKVDPDSKSDHKRTPLSYAAERGHEEVVKLLLEKDEVDPASKDSEYGRTPLLWALVNGHDAIVKLFNKVDKY